MSKKGQFFDITQPQNYVLRLIHPVIGDTGATLTLIAPTDDRYVKRLTLIYLEKMKKTTNTFKEDQDEEFSIDNLKDFSNLSDKEWLDIVRTNEAWHAKELAALVEDWSEHFGEDFTRKDLEDLLADSNYAWMKEAIEEKLKDDSTFFLNKKSN